jgi:hypothetical protein
MKKAGLLVVGTLAALSYVAAASPARGQGAPSGGAAPAKSIVGPIQKVTGKVEDVDHATGLLTLKQPAGDVKLYFPPASLESIQKGNQVTVRYAFARGTHGEQAKHSSPAGLGQSRVTGTVTAVDEPAKRWIQVKADAGTLQMPFPANVVHQLKIGDQVNIDVAFARGFR